MQKKLVIKIGLLIVAVTAVAAMFFLSQPNAEAATQQSFFQQFVVAGGPIVWFILLPMSMFTVYLAIELSGLIRSRKITPTNIAKDIIAMTGTARRKDLIATLAARDDFVSTAIRYALKHGHGDKVLTRSLVSESLQEQSMAILRKNEWANIIGNVSPMVGLFGTVYGMIKAFNSIVVAGGQPQPAMLAEGISVALVTTFWGLVVAIPALGLYGIFRNLLEGLVSLAAIEAEMVCRHLAKKSNRPTNS